jgi:hypothetical protein
MSTAGEKAMALVDGQLAPAELPDLVQELARNGPLVAEVQEYLALSRNRLASAFAAKAEEPLPSRLVDTIMRTPAPAAVTPAGQPLLARALAWLQGSYRVPAWSLAAAPALAALMLAAVWWTAPVPGRGPSLLEADLGPALERT